MSSNSDEARMLKIEVTLDKIKTILGNLVSKSQTQQLNIIRQKDIKSLQERVTSLETSISNLENTIATLL